MHRAQLLAHTGPHLRAELDEAGGSEVVEAGVATLRLDDGVVVASIGYVQPQKPEPRHLDFHVTRGEIARHVADTDRGHAPTLGGVGDAQHSRRYLDRELAGHAR